MEGTEPWQLNGHQPYLVQERAVNLIGDMTL